MKTFPVFSSSHLEKEKQTKYSKIKTEDLKNLPVLFQTSLSNRAGLEEKKIRRFQEFLRPKSAFSVSGIGFIETNPKEFLGSWEALWRTGSFESIARGSGERIKHNRDGKKPFEVRECRRRPKAWSPSAWGTERLDDDGKWCSCHLQRKYRSAPNVSSLQNFVTTSLQKSKKILDGGGDLYKFRKSLGLLGFEISDFGFHSRESESGQKWKRDKPTTLATKPSGRSVSLESVRLTVKQAWANDRLDESHRRLLAKAAYEEWYFKKEKELCKKREKEKTIRVKAKESLKDDFQRKKEKSEEEFKKWLLGKRMKEKENKENLPKNQNSLLDKKEESEKAFIRWKQTKERELRKQKKEKQKEEEKRIESEKEKIQKKINGEKAFQNWKSKLEEAERSAEMKMGSAKKKKGEQEEKKKRKEKSSISFHLWKAAKDEQMKEKKKQIREVEQITRKEQQVQMKERFYEAQQAFQEWLERVDSRQEQQYSDAHGTDQKIIPWIPI